jgi:hypothetical protein
MLVWIALVVGCEPATLIVTEMDYEDPGSPELGPVIDEDGDGYEASVDCDDDDPDVFPDAPERCNGLDDDCDEEVDEEEICPCETREDEGVVYSLCTEALVSEEALALCREAGMELVKLDDLAEQLLIIDWLSEFAGSSWLIGLNDRDVEDEWVWSDGSEMRWSRWNDGEPNDWGSGEDCVELRPQQDNWNDIGCNQNRPFICEAF